MKNISNFLYDFFSVSLVVKFSTYLNRRVFVMLNNTKSVSKLLLTGSKFIPLVYTPFQREKN